MTWRAEHVGHTYPQRLQCELARDQFIRALVPTELRVQVQLQHPLTLQSALDIGRGEGECVGPVGRG
ncbi:hypothetical protein NHX12_017431 [Muraenolepis orangiensis]|uniref:Uncharacterized protein n=1 Tax=Muraenolepis orangiensis TaxID=630683 RepID=A0A9Q0I1S2_9TELE|nr:hypothetical protein NHX12_017431 [Muraenolepis orangiensis]